jgi:ATP-dependent Clp protease adaptor protein ClpS
MSDIDLAEDIKIDEKIKAVDTEPSKYKVVMLNDDVTPMDWVIQILTEIFKHSRESAEKITLTIHNEGSAVVGIYTYEIAEMKALEATNMSRNQGFPLQVKLDKE